MWPHLLNEICPIIEFEKKGVSGSISIKLIYITKHYKLQIHAFSTLHPTTDGKPTIMQNSERDTPLEV